MSWSHEQTALLIELYERYPCLYAVKHPDYHNKHRRSIAINAIVEGLKVLRPTVTEQDVQKKFLGLRTTYAQERRKVLESIHSGMGEEEVYRPTLWYFDKLNFLSDHLQMRSSRSSHPVENAGGGDKPLTVVDSSPLELQPEALSEYVVGSDGMLSPVSERPSSGLSVLSDATPSDTQGMPSTSYAQKKMATPTPNTPTPKRLKKTDSEIQVLQNVSTSLGNLTNVLHKDPSPPTADEIMGQFVASQLKKIRNDDIKQDVYFEIHRILREGIKKDKE